MTDIEEPSAEPAPVLAAASSPRPPIDWWEIIATVLLSMATLASAFSGYQASRWGAEQSVANRAAATARTESTRQSNVANRHVLVDVTAFAAWTDAVAAGDERLKDFLADRFRPEFAVAVDEWLAGAPPGEIPPGTPFDSEAYELAANAEADRLIGVAEAEVGRADDAANRSDNFVLTAVLYASVLFFAGIASKMSGLYASRIAVGLAGLMFVIATAVLISLPWSLQL